MPRLASFTAITALIFMGAPIRGLAAPPVSWIAHSWQTDDGLPSNDVGGITQASDGTILAATHRGLAKFDGKRLSPVSSGPPETQGEGVGGVLNARDGSLWLVTSRGLVNRRDGRDLATYPLKNRERFTSLTAFFESRSGDIWLSYNDGRMYRVHDRKIELPAVIGGLSSSFADCLAEDSEGTVWAVGDRVLAKFTPAGFTPHADLPGSSVFACGAKDGGLWLSIDGTLFRYREGEELRKITSLGSGPLRNVSAMREDSRGRVWVGTFGDGLYTVTGNEAERVAVSNSDIWSLAGDREGNLWVATGGGGICRVRPRAVSLLAENGLPTGQTPRSMAQGNDGDIWVALQTKGELYRHRQGVWQQLVPRKDWPDEGATCVTAAADGNIWIAAESGAVYQYRDGGFHAAPLPEPTTGRRIRSLMVAREGSLWITRGRTVHRLKGDAVASFPLVGPGEEMGTVVEDAQGTIWAASLGESLYRVDGDHFDAHQPGMLGTERGIRTLLATPDGALWVSRVGKGLLRLQGNQKGEVTTASGLHDDMVSQLLLDAEGKIWAASDRGIFSCDLKKLTAVAEGREASVHCKVYGASEALPSLQANSGYQPNRFVARDGRIWLATRKGIAIVDPTATGENLVPPPVAVTDITTNGIAIPPQPEIEIGPGVESLRMGLAAYSFTAPENVTLRHRLIGLDRTWNDSSSERVATYNHLPPGHYVLEIEAKNNDGIPSETPTRLAIHVLPYFWQTQAFHFGIATLCLGLTAWFVRWFSLRQARRETSLAKREAEIERERTRIARDMHDEVGASLTRISLLSELVNHDEQPSPHLPKLSLAAQEAVTALDRIVWAVNPRHDNLASFLDYTAQQCGELLQAAGIRCRLHLPDHADPCPLPADYRHQVFLMIREAVNNATKHAGAGEITLTIQPSDAGLAIRIEDDGKGFASSDESGDGLGNMQSRAASLRGTCLITSQPGAGTRVEFNLPWPSRGSTASL